MYLRTCSAPSSSLSTEQSAWMLLIISRWQAYCEVRQLTDVADCGGGISCKKKKSAYAGCCMPVRNDRLCRTLSGICTWQHLENLGRCGVGTRSRVHYSRTVRDSWLTWYINKTYVRALATTYTGLCFVLFFSLSLPSSKSTCTNLKKKVSFRILTRQNMPNRPVEHLFAVVFHLLLALQFTAVYRKTIGRNRGQILVISF